MRHSGRHGGQDDQCNIQCRSEILTYLSSPHMGHIVSNTSLRGLENSSQLSICSELAGTEQMPYCTYTGNILYSSYGMTCGCLSYMHKFLIFNRSVYLAHCRVISLVMYIGEFGPLKLQVD